MAPLLKPSECSVLVLDIAGEPSVHDADVIAARNRILQAASLCGIPAFLAMRDRTEAATHGAQPKSSNQQIYSPPMPGNPWAETPLGLTLAKASRTSLLICGYWLDERITFTALNALGEGYDIYLVTDASPPLEVDHRHIAILRLVQAGVVPTTTRQVIREWAGEIPDAENRAQLLALL